MSVVSAAVRPVPRYQRGLFIAFALFNLLRVISYLPTFWAIHASGDSSQHSLWTWLTWCGSNLLTGLWHLECHQRRLDCTAVVLFVNAAMCAAAVVLVATYR
jgi:hypothetical protein